MIHLYYGDGKGKTTAAVGLALRAAGSGMRVLFAQFFKNGRSSETKAIAAVDGIELRLPHLYYGRFKTMNDQQKQEIGAAYRSFLQSVIQTAAQYDLIVLDEAVSAYGYGLFDANALCSFLQTEGEQREIVLTGREPLPELIALADYATQMRKEKHPYDRGVPARKGIEF